MDQFVKAADVIVTGMVGLIASYLAHSYWRNVALTVAEKRLAAYAALWSKMMCASPVRLAPWMDSPLTMDERKKLFDSFTAVATPDPHEG